MTDQRQVGRPSGMRTRIIILTGPTPSSTLCIPEEYGRFDLLIHCGNLTQHSTGSEFGQVMRYIRRFNVGPKILIAGDKDVSLDPQAYRFHSRRQVHVAEESTAVYEDPKADEVDAGAPAPSADAAPIESRTQALGKERRLQTRKYERPEATRTRMQKMWRWNVRFLNEGTQEILLPNRAPLRLYVSSYTPDAGKSLAFQYQTHHHDFSIEPDTDIVVTHGPPWAVLDRSPPESSALYCKGSTSLWHAIKRAPPRLHCFGPERTWRGAAVATWQGSDSPLWAEVDATQEPDSQELSGTVIPWDRVRRYF
ncbi:hypothetical protein ISF_02023 [Cordyceps fumosorosea ARSEF 2679]|uniref:Metallophosphoesterase domain protein n=1 Tax=Cordyceps fumosorosea (strain ARSEF 2679) TaxID=1081104 RepID=A0A162JNG8_CORFA|nr:hypothetical protein ISF_02023 [Cordyceps fumosorosea ARSEF 2679]OAA71472.1 hypothetical protein ISF_02023 [Cordyceps fumosorosea ARSEF 2679]